MKNFLPTIDVIIDVETIGIFKHNYKKVADIPLLANGIRNAKEGRKTSKEAEKEAEKAMIISNAVFNVGITLQHKGRILKTSSGEECSWNIGIREFWEYPEHRILDFYRKNFEKDGSDFHYMYETFAEFLYEFFYPLLKSFKKSANLKLWSYNAMFDSRAFVDTAKLENEEIPKPILANWNCIFVLAANTIVANKDVKFVNWAVEKEYELIVKNRLEQGKYISEKGNVRTNAQTIYRYISGDDSFIEAHKGMEDTQIEGEILEWCKKFNRWSLLDSTPNVAWTIVNYKALPFQSIGHLDHETIQSMLTETNQEKLVEIYENFGRES